LELKLNKTKIIKIQITLERQFQDLELSPDITTEIIELTRNKEKIWYAESDLTSRKGLFPMEIRLAVLGQELIDKFGGSNE
jgi:hypothetical protein